MGHTYAVCRYITCISRNAIYKKHSAKNRPIAGKLPLIFVGLGLALSLIGVALIPEFSPIASASSASIPNCASDLFLLLIDLVLVFVFYLRRRKNR